MRRINLLEGCEFSIFFHLRRTFTYENGEHPIVMRVNYYKTRRDIVTGLSCRSEDWNSDNNRVEPVDAGFLILRSLKNSFSSYEFAKVIISGRTEVSAF
jgi:hypothetical protein